MISIMFNAINLDGILKINGKLSVTYSMLNGGAHGKELRLLK